MRRWTGGAFSTAVACSEEVRSAFTRLELAVQERCTFPSLRETARTVSGRQTKSAALLSPLRSEGGADMQSDLLQENQRELELTLMAMKRALNGEPCPAGFDAGVFRKYADDAKDNKSMLNQRISAMRKRLAKQQGAHSSEKARRRGRATEKLRVLPLRVESASSVPPPPPAAADVPAPPSAGLLQQPTGATMGQLPPGVTAEVDVVLVSDGVLGLSNLRTMDNAADHRLLVRNRYYPAVWEKVAGKLRRSGTQSILVVLGQPGIGKTVGVGNFCVLRCLDAFPDAVVAIAEYENSFRVIYTEDGSRKRWFFESAAPFKSHVLSLNAAAPLLIVHDVKTARGRTRFSVNYNFINACRQRFTTMLAMILTSPQDGNYSYTCKMNMDLSQVALPTWSDDELIAGGFITGPNDPRLALRGGVPRSYTHNDQCREMLMHRAIVRMRQFKTSPECSSDLVQLMPSKSRGGLLMMAPVSRRAADMIAWRFGPHVHAHFMNNLWILGPFDRHFVEWWFLSLLRAMAPMPTGYAAFSAPRELCDVVLRLYSIPASTPRTLAYKHKRLHSIRPFGGSTVAHLFKAIADVAQAAGIVVGNGHHVALIPEAPNFPVVDAVVLTWNARNARWSMVAFRSIAAASPPAAAGAAEAFRKHLERETATIALESFVYVGLGAGGVDGEQVAKCGLPFLSLCQQWWMDIRYAEVVGSAGVA